MVLSSTGVASISMEVKDLENETNPDVLCHGAALCQEPRDAVVLYQKAIGYGSTAAKVGLGVLLLTGRKEVPQDKIGAVKWFQKAAEEGDGDA